MSRIIHFEVHCTDVKRAADFYGRIFGWKFQQWPGPWEYLIVTTGENTEPGINGGLMPRKHPDGRVYNTIAVEDLESTIKRVEANGGSICVPKMLIPGVGNLAYFKDTEGNVHGIMEALKG